MRTRCFGMNSEVLAVVLDDVAAELTFSPAQINYSVYCLYELYAEGKLSSPHEIETLDVLDAMCNEIVKE